MNVMTKSLRVVIADDVSDIRDLLKIWLGEPDFEVVGEADDGAEAVAVVAREQPDAVLLDLSMPIMDGLEAIPQIRRMSSDTKIVILSGFNRAIMGQRALDLGADAYMEKGTDLNEVASLLQRLCAA